MITPVFPHLFAFWVGDKSLMYIYNISKERIYPLNSDPSGLGRLGQKEEKMKINSAMRITGLLLTLVMLLGIIPVTAATSDSLPTMINVEIVGDILYFDAYENAKVYTFGIKNAGGYFDPLTDSSGKILKRQQINLKDFCVEHEIPSGTFDVRLCAMTDYGWRGGSDLTTFWRGQYTYVTDKPQLSKPKNVRLGAFDLSWDPVPNATKYSVVIHRMNSTTQLIDTTFRYETSNTNIDLREAYVPTTTEYSIYLTAFADGYFRSEEYAFANEKDKQWLEQNLSDKYIKNVKVSSDGILSWDAYPKAKAYKLYVGNKNTIISLDDLDSSNGRLSCDLNYYCTAFGCTASALNIGVNPYSDNTSNDGYSLGGITYVTYNFKGTTALTGEVSYSGDPRFGSTIYAHVSGTPSGAELIYEWQVHKNGYWVEIDSAANKNSLKISSADLVGEYIRVKVSAKSSRYQGSVCGASKLVAKLIPNKALDTPQLSYTVTKSGGKEYARIEIHNYKSDVEYVVTESAVTGSKFPTSQKITSKSFDKELSENAKIYYIYARYAETATSECSSYFVSGSIIVPAKGQSTGYAMDLIYPEYDTKTPKIYMKVGSTIKIKYQINPSGAISNLPKWNTTYSCVGVTNDTASKTLTIKANKVGNTFITAYKSSDGVTPWYYGSDYSNMGRSINVIVYDPSDLSSVPLIKTDLGTVELFIGDKYTVDLTELSKLPFVPDGVDKSKYKYSAYLLSKDNMTGMPYVGQTSKDGSCTISNAVISAVKEGEATVYVFAKTNSSTPVTADSYFAHFKVKVTKKPTAVLESISLIPKELTLRVGESSTLKATKNPVNASGTFKWSSGNTSVLKVDSNGKVTAVGKGKTNVTVELNGKKAVCSVEVLPAYCSKHTKVYSYANGNTHAWSCSVCGAYGSESHKSGAWNSNATQHFKYCEVNGCNCMISSSMAAHDFKTVIDKAATATAAGSKHEECKVCGYKKASAVIPSLGSTPADTTTPDDTTLPADSGDTPVTAPNDDTSSPDDTTSPDGTTSPEKPDDTAGSDDTRPGDEITKADTDEGSQQNSGGGAMIWIIIIAAVVVIAVVCTVVYLKKRK